MTTTRELSKENCLATSRDIEFFNLGSLQRIADATEKMTVAFDSIIQSRVRYQQLYEAEVRKNHALRGVISRMKGRQA